MRRLASSGRARAALSLCALATAALIVACSDSTAPGSHGVTPAQAYATLDSVDHDSARGVEGYAWGDLGMILAAYGSPVTSVTATVNGQAEQFNAVVGEFRFDTAGVPRDSAIVVVAWRGAEAHELILAEMIHDPSQSGTGYQAGIIGYIQGSSAYTTNLVTTASGFATLKGGGCSMFAAPDTSDKLTPLYQSKTTSCQTARVTANVSQKIFNQVDSTDVRTVSLSVSQIAGVRANVAVR